MIKKKIKLSPIMTLIILIFTTILLSGFLYFINVQAEYTTVNKAGDIVNNVVEVKNIFSFSGLKHIATTAVQGFVNFEPLAMLLIILIGIGVLEKTGFTRAFFTLLTRNSKKLTITFILVFISLIFSLVGDIGYVIMLPLGALLFKYGRRNPLGGIIASFASLSFGYGINALLSSNDSTLLTMTINAARTVDPKYSIGVFFALFFMVLLLIVTAIVFTNVTEKKIMPKLSRFEHEEEAYVLVKKDLRGLIVGVGAGIIYLLLVVYMIIPGLPLSGALLDHGGTRYIDMLFGNNSLFSQGFVFIVTLWFIIIGLGYGLMTRTIKNNKDITDGLGHSLDGIGGVIVLIFLSSLLINIFNESNIGIVITAAISNIIAGLSFTGIWLIIISFVLIMIANIFCPNSLLKWSIISASMVPLFMNASISPEYSQIVYTAADSVTNGITPLLIYFVIYVAFMEKYNKTDNMTTLFGSTRYMIPYFAASFAIWFVILVGYYMTGLPTGIGSFPGVTYGA